MVGIVVETVSWRTAVLRQPRAKAFPRSLKMHFGLRKALVFDW